MAVTTAGTATAGASPHVSANVNPLSAVGIAEPYQPLAIWVGGLAYVLGRVIPAWIKARYRLREVIERQRGEFEARRRGSRHRTPSDD
jgi:hypothetical protein